MLFGLKTRLMRGVIAKRQAQRPFDYEAGEQYVLPDDADEALNNSYYFSAHGEAGESLYCRLGLRAAYAEVWFFYSAGGKTYTHKKLLATTEVPLAVTREEGGWRISYEGELTTEGGETCHAVFSGLFHSEEEAVDFFTHMPPERTARAMAAERWSRAFFSEVQKNNQVHYEQTGRLDGTLLLNGEERRLSLPCVRDHSYGRRVWGYMNNHLWLMAINENSELNFSMVSYPAMTLLEVGNLKTAEGEMRYVIGADYDRAAVAGGQVPKTLSLSLRMDDDSTHFVVAMCEHVTEYVFEDGAYRLLEGIGRFTVDGVSYRGIIEVGVNGDSARIYNGKSIKELRG